MARFRTQELSFFSYYGLLPFPKDENYFMIPFFGDSQGYEWWHILLNGEGEHCILYNRYHWNEHYMPNKPKEHDSQYYICANSFGEFLIRLSADIKAYEGEHPEARYQIDFPYF